MRPSFQFKATAAFSSLLLGMLVVTGHDGSTAVAREVDSGSWVAADCNDCPGVTCQSSEHAVEYFSPVEWGTKDGLHDCYFGSCAAHGHTFVLCEGGEDAQAVLDALATATVAEVEGIISSHQLTASYNAAREAIQVVGCDGTIMAHIPMDRPN
jgi:hypothetical protein